MRRRKGNTDSTAVRCKAAAYKMKSTWDRRCRKDLPAVILLASLSFFFCWFFIGQYGIFGSKVDWISQHSVIPDYFRQQFYETGELFPEFAPNIGGGQNIYNFSYYGLYSPVILLSYLLPFVKMGDYIMAASMTMAALSAVLFYLWLRSRYFSREISFWCAMMLELSGPMIFHAARHTMFVSYMPFLILALWGIDRYFTEGKSGIYITGVFLMIMTSFYFSIGGMLVLCIYGLHRYFTIPGERSGVDRGSREVRGKGENRESSENRQGSESRTAHRNWTFVVQFVHDAFWFLLPMLTAVLMSAFLLVPTAYALMGKREASGRLTLQELFMPKFSVSALFYHSYGIGLPSFAATVLLAGLVQKKAGGKILTFSCIAVLIFPFFPWILNGGLYPRDKALIPFLPLLCYVAASYLRDRQEDCGGQEKAVRRFSMYIPYVLVAALLIWESGFGAAELIEAFAGLPSALAKGGVLAGRYQSVLLILDAVLMLLCCGIFCLRKKLIYLMAPPVLFLAVFGNSFHSTANVEKREFYGRVTDERTAQAVRTVLAEEEGFYRMEQCGTYEENMANVNRILDTRQYITSVYASSYHDRYRAFCRETFGIEEPTRNALIQQISQNPSFRSVMGVKYIVMQTGAGDEEEKAEKRQQSQLCSSGYEVCYDKDGVQIYKNEDVSPVGYVAERTITQETYEALDFPYNQIALEFFAVADSGSEKRKTVVEELAKYVKEISLEFAEEKTTPESKHSTYNIEKIEKLNTDLQNGYFKVDYFEGRCQEKNVYVKAERKQSVEAVVKGEEDNAMFNQPWILYLQFTVKNLHPNEEIAISVEGVQNKLSASTHLYKNDNTVFTYAVPMQAGKTEVEITFGKGEYELADIQCFARQTDVYGKKVYGNREQSGWRMNAQCTKGKTICGTIQAKQTGWFVTSIPYDENFAVFIDGRETPPRVVNTAFLGILIPEGEHTITLVYRAPGLAEGKAVSVFGGFLFIGFSLAWKRKNRYDALA